MEERERMGKLAVGSTSVGKNDSDLVFVFFFFEWPMMLTD